MAKPPGNRHFLAWVGLTTLVLVAGMLLLLGVLLRQAQSVEDAARLQTDSVTALTFQFEREFLRLRTELRLATETPRFDDWEELTLRHDIFLSRVQLLSANPSMDMLRGRPEYEALLPRIVAFAERSEKVLSPAQPDLKELQQLRDDMQALGPEVQALTSASNSLVAHALEARLQTVRTQSVYIAAFIAALVLVMIAAAAALVRRNRHQLREQLALNRLNRNLREAQLEAETASESKSRFLANMSHELRTPFNGLLGMLNLLESTPLEPRQREFVVTAKESAQHLLNLLDDILDLSAIEAGKIHLQPGPVNLPRLLHEVQTLVRSLALGKGLALEFGHDEALPAWVVTDATRLRQVLYNLLGNAVKFTPRGEVRFSVHAEPLADPAGVPGHRVTFVVQDTGIGIKPDIQDRLFHRFYQADAQANRAFGGAGLGLDISRTLARMMGGEVSVSSVEGSGSTFTLVLPLPTCDAPDSMPQNAPPPAGLRVLVAEDHPVNRKLVGALLERMGHTALFAEDGQQALELARTQSPDLVLMDLHMPVMDGLDSTRQIRALPGPQSRVPVIALTADVMGEAREKALQAGANDFLSKPVLPAQLQQAIARNLGG